MNDMELMSRYAAGEEGAFQELVNQYKDSVYAFLRRFLNRLDLVDGHAAAKKGRTVLSSREVEVLQLIAESNANK
jgi:hypothetical protein